MKTLLMSLLITLISVVSLKAQDSLTFVGSHLTITPPSLVNAEVSEFWRIPIRDRLFNNVNNYGSQPPNCKWKQAIYREINFQVIHESDIADVEIVEIISIGDTAHHYALGAVLLKSNILVDPQTGQQDFHFSHPIGEYFIRMTHRNSISIWSNIAYRLEGQEISYVIDMSTPKSVFGKEPLWRLPDGNYALKTGDPSLDGHADLTDYLMTFNGNGAIGWKLTNLNFDFVTNAQDLQYALLAWEGLWSEQSPLDRPNQTLNINPMDNNTPYRLTAQVLESPNPNECFIDIKMSSSSYFIFGGIQPVLTFESPLGITSYEVENSIGYVLVQNLLPSRIEILMVPSPGVDVMIDGVERLVCRLKMQGSSVTDLLWDNTSGIHTKVAKKLLNGQLEEITDAANHWVIGTTGIGNEVGHPTKFALHQNFPNPFNPSTTISYDLPTSQSITLKVYNALGACIQNLYTGYQVAGNHKVRFDASKYSSGIYYCQIESDKFLSVIKMTLIK